jgi:CheY-like chemotaxis protein
MTPDNTVGRPMEILFIEDSLTFARIAIAAMKGTGILHRLTWLADGESALAFLHRQKHFAQAPRPDLMLLDLTLPAIDGREVLRRTRTSDEYRNLPIVVMTASTDESDHAEAEKLDVQDYLVKPFDIARFLDLIQTLSRYWKQDLIVPGA